MNLEKRNEHLERWLDRIQDSIDGSLDASAQASVAKHLAECADCRSEYDKIRQVHDRFAQEFSAVPALNANFSARVFAAIDEYEHTRRAAAKLRAEREFQKRREAFAFDWRSFWQRHMGSVIGALTAFAAVAATAGSQWASIRGQLVNAFPTLSFLQGSLAMPALTVVSSLLVSAGALWFLRTKAR